MEYAVAMQVPMAVWDPSVVQKLLLSVLGLVIIIVAIRIGGRANNAQYSETARVGFNTLVAIVIGGIGAGTIAFAVFGKQLLATFGITI
jgi:hypothetical protein